MAGAPPDQFKVVASGFLHLFASQVASRLITFILNLFIARHLTPEAYGLSSVQFHLLTTTILLLSREGFRRGCLRFGGKAGGVDSWQVLRVAWLVVPCGAVVTAGVCSVVLYSHRAASSRPTESTELVPAYAEAVILHGVAAIVELLAEPFYILAAARLNFRVRVVVDTVGMVAKSCVALALVRASSLPPALVFSLAQLALAAASLLGYGAYGIRVLLQGEGRRSLLGWGSEEKDVMWTSAMFGLQAAEKLALGEGSKLVLAAVQSRYNQGVYGLVANLGGLVVRVVFQPLEEAAFTAFSTWHTGKADSAHDQHAAADDSMAAAVAKPDTDATLHHRNAAAAAATAQNDKSKNTHQKQQHEQQEHLERLSAVLGVMMKTVCLLGLLAVAFGPAYSYSALRLVYGVRWSETEAPKVLAVYCAYILLLALNGISEAFVHAVLDARGLQQSNMLLLAASGMHLAACAYAVPRWGAVGLVGADAANMLLRILYSLWCIRRFFAHLKGFSVQRVLPAPATLCATAAAAAAVSASQMFVMAGKQGGHVPTSVFLKGAAVHVGFGVVVLGVLLAVVYRCERGTIRAFVRLRRGGGGGGAAAADAISHAKEA